jgi:hypothetical protein
LSARSVSDKKNDSKRLKDDAKMILRILSKEDSRSRALHHLLLQKVNPSGYERKLQETEEATRLAKIREEREYEERRERRKINGIIERYSIIDKENFMRAREIYRRGDSIPRNLQKYIQVIEAEPYLTFENELSAPKQVTRLTMSGQDYQYRQNFPAFGAVTQSNAWTQKLGTKVEKKTTVVGAWTKSLDTEVLAKLPDPPKVVSKKNNTSLQLHNECEDDHDDDYGSDAVEYDSYAKPDEEYDDEW